MENNLQQAIEDFENEFGVDLEAQACYCCGEIYPGYLLLETDSQLLCDLCSMWDTIPDF